MGHIWRTVCHCCQPQCRASLSGSMRPAVSIRAQRLDSSPINHLKHLPLCHPVLCSGRGSVPPPCRWECLWEGREAQGRDHQQASQTGTSSWFGSRDANLHLLNLLFTRPMNPISPQLQEERLLTATHAQMPK